MALLSNKDYSVIKKKLSRFCLGKARQNVESPDQYEPNWVKSLNPADWITTPD